MLVNSSYFCIFFCIMRKFTEWSLKNTVAKFLNKTKFPTQEEREVRGASIALFLYSIFYYGIISIIGYQVLSQLPFFYDLLKL